MASIYDILQQIGMFPGGAPGATPQATPPQPGGAPAPMSGANQPALPANAQPAATPAYFGSLAPAMGQEQPAPSMFQNLAKGTPLSGVADWASARPSTMMALAAGFAGAPSFGAGMSRAFSNASGGMWMDQDRAEKDRARKSAGLQQNMTWHWLQKRGMDPDQATALIGNPAALKDYMKHAFAPKQPEYGLNPVWGVDAQGNPAIMQLGKDGKPVQTQLPPGMSIAKDPIKLDAGTEWILLDPQTRQPVGRIPKDLAGAEEAKVAGKTQGEAKAALPTSIANADQTVSQIDELLSHPGLPYIVGPLDQYNRSWMLDDKGRDALARYDQLQGRAFLEAYGTLRGGGAITEVEGAKAQAAIARMNRSQGEEDFRRALSDFRDAVKTGVQKMRERAGAGGTGPVQGAAPVAQPVPGGQGAPAAPPAVANGQQNIPVGAMVRQNGRVFQKQPDGSLREAQ